MRDSFYFFFSATIFCISLIFPFGVTDYVPWWRHQMETFSALLAICAGNSPVPGEFPAQRPVTRSFDVFFDLRLNKRLNKQSWGWWFETLSFPLWRQYNEKSSSKLHSCSSVDIPYRYRMQCVPLRFRIFSSFYCVCVCVCVNVFAQTLSGLINRFFAWHVLLLCLSYDILHQPYFSLRRDWLNAVGKTWFVKQRNQRAVDNKTWCRLYLIHRSVSDITRYWCPHICAYHNNLVHYALRIEQQLWLI